MAVPTYPEARDGSVVTQLATNVIVIVAHAASVIATGSSHSHRRRGPVIAEATGSGSVALEFVAAGSALAWLAAVVIAHPSCSCRRTACHRLALDPDAAELDLIVRSNH